jgi:hypothetical protein
MDLDRGRLGTIDRKVFAGLGHDERYWMVRVPVSEAMWSMWRRYSQAVGVSMGRGIVGLIANELGTVADPDTGGGTVFAAEMQRRFVRRSEGLEARERRLDERERSLRAAERRLRARTTPLGSSDRVKVGRNEPCPCGSGFKYKRCHGP